MSISIDLYDFQKVLVRSPDDESLDWILSNGESKPAYVVTVGEEGMPAQLAEALHTHGCEDGDSVIVVVQ